MATYGVSYAGQRNPRGYGVLGSRTLSSLYGNASMQPMAATPRPGFIPISQIAPPLDTISGQVANGQNLFNQIAPATPKVVNHVPTQSPSSTVNGNDLSADPILAQIKALGQKSVNDAASGDLAQAENDLVNYGDVNVPQSLRDYILAQTPKNDPLLGDLPSNPVLGALNDANTATAAANNPFSVVKQLSSAHDTNDHNIDQASNLANLYYSSTHANQLGDENQNYLGAQNTALQNLASLLSGRNNDLIDAVNAAHQQYLGELPNAYARAIANGSGDPTNPPPGGGNSTLAPPSGTESPYPRTPGALPPLGVGSGTDATTTPRGSRTPTLAQLIAALANRPG